MKKEALFLMTGLLVAGFAGFLLLLPEDHFLNQADVSLLYFLNGSRLHDLDPFWLWVSNISFYVAILVPLSLYAYSRWKELPEWRWKSYLVALAWGISVVVLNIMKYTINRPRPFSVLEGIEKLGAGGSPSFPSGHTIEAFSVALTVMLLSAGPGWLRVLLLLWAVMVAYSRICLGVHYPSDVMAAIGLGMAIAGGVVRGTPSR